ncbi:Domain of uncharacterised function (DUF1840) [Delftia tsuruhatensis]|uniref:DUF1840 domain-containing protein n=1 Tax=Delftia tsuruhatensis TaxID=180282 RepID=UPI001E753408|nr:DUF1840 domain-containing protein [Delftia tsuruhatensis]CAB5675151.1 Domain of uncharacterised function (DUF1840) [Delftia tsuruhatensis]CAC9692607.1 Domain of uncharacterised function (DUF1840) [Delftia tsuruhatensis]
MLYKFKSRATADVIMLESNGRQVLEIIGKTPGASGIITAQQIPAAIEALEAAVADDDARRKARSDESAQEGGQDDAALADAVSLRQRAAPMIDMLRRSAAEGRDVTW